VESGPSVLTDANSLLDGRDDRAPVTPGVWVEDAPGLAHVKNRDTDGWGVLKPTNPGV
jgi:hypothetical protein